MSLCLPDIVALLYQITLSWTIPSFRLSSSISSLSPLKRFWSVTRLMLHKLCIIDIGSSSGRVARLVCYTMYCVDYTSIVQAKSLSPNSRVITRLSIRSFSGMNWPERVGPFEFAEVSRSLGDSIYNFSSIRNPLIAKMTFASSNSCSFLSFCFVHPIFSRHRNLKFCDAIVKL